MNSEPPVIIKLTHKEFLEVIAREPPICIDLVVRDSKNRILLGRRLNEPAKGKWLTPGGLVYKSESLADAFSRICTSEIKQNHSYHEARFLGNFAQTYSTNASEAQNAATHYVALAFELRISDNFKLPKTEHYSELRWFSDKEDDPNPTGHADSDVHEHVLPYFRDGSGMELMQYQVLSARRDSFNILVWQTPVISLTAQAFLFIIIFSKEISDPGRVMACILALIVALGSLQLLAKQRFMETQHAVLLESFEKARGWYTANRQFRSSNWTVRLSSYVLWRVVLWAFFIAAVLSLIMSLRGGLLK